MMQERERLTPYELVFGHEIFAQERFPAIEEEARTRGIDVHDPRRFALLAEAGQLMRAILGDDAPGTALHEISALVYHAFEFWHSGKHTFVLSDDDLSSIASGTRVPAGVLTFPHDAGYLQLPRNMVWSRVEAEATPEPVDGVFWRALASRSEPAQLELLAILGLREDRPGLSMIRVSDELPRGTEWLRAPAREDGADFTNVLPGGEYRNLHAFVNGAEVLKFVGLTFGSVQV